ncbi:flagellar hook-associated protein FlgK [Solidesulfovibrio fructosivorans JJ]]|uniref:Flagellar hook-associated protein 1 n=1 Tax=Solidesulfovibrio fructosivorans JJ] TaxID=596151 RepID=E1JZC2_SOLFR|nr:flagellar hook-associated protein FlgK [Solidesulfovibrio fructosivorans]EFL50282.1 flagellar hook-associated protein FlgK [Solidesulfovibrio fructosivorans JJ]]
MSSLSSILSIGRSGLTASQAALQVTGNNIANVDTEGYSKQSVVLVDGNYITSSPGQLGSGVVAQEVVRSYDALTQSQYLSQISVRDRWKALYNGLTSIQSYFNESNTNGANAALSTVFGDWGDLTANTADTATRQTMLEDTNTLLSIYRSMASSLEDQKAALDTAITDDVATLNQLAKDVADINRQINQHQIDGKSIPNGLYDLRDSKVENIASMVDVNVVDNGKGDYTVYTKSGQTIVDGTEAYSFDYKQGQTVRQLSAASLAANSDAQCYYEGTDSHEYTVRVVNTGGVGTGATFKVSLDGGHSWLTDANGNTAIYQAEDTTGKVKVGDLDIWFGQMNDSGTAPTSDLNAGDTFTLVPKKALYWHTTAGTEENVTPQLHADGTDDERRLTGGALAGALLLRDENLAGYQDSLDATVNSMVWEINRIHSQGAGLTNFSSVQGTYGVVDSNAALGSNQAGLTYGNRLASGAAMIYVYDANGNLASSDGIWMDPTATTLNDFVTSINTAFSGTLNASVVNGRLAISAASGYSFQFGDDSSGILAALGVNTLLTGSTASDVAINSVVTGDTNRVNVGHVGTDGLTASGDNTTAKSMTGLADKKVDFFVTGKATANQTISGYYGAMVGQVGADTASANYQATYQTALASQIKDQKLSISGVSLDEELTNLIKFQHAYQAAAKLISTADSLFQTVLGLKN